AAAPNVDADTPAFDQGDTADNPNPAPRAKRIRYKAAATEAPPITAVQETPDECMSPLEFSRSRRGSRGSAEATLLAIRTFLRRGASKLTTNWAPRMRSLRIFRFKTNAVTASAPSYRRGP